MPDLFVLLIVLLVLALVWRGPKTLPQLGAIFGRGVKAARDEANRMRSEQPPSDDPDGPKPA